MDKKEKGKSQGKGTPKESSSNRKPSVPRHLDPYGKRQGTVQSDDSGVGDFIEGRNAVIEALRAGVAIDKVYIASGETDASLKHIASLARAAGAVVSETDRRKLDTMSDTHSHQGVIAAAACTGYALIEDILGIARKRSEAPLIVLCDGITDPHNLGAIIRTCEAAGAHGVIIPKHRSAGLSATVAKTSSGAVYHVAVARVTNMTAAVKELKGNGLWISGASAGSGLPLWQADMKRPTAFVIGSEGTGISRLVRDNCDMDINIPMHGKIASLNASVSAAVLLYEAVRQRRTDITDHSDGRGGHVYGGRK